MAFNLPGNFPTSQLVATVDGSNFLSDGGSKPSVEMASTRIAKPFSVSTGARRDEASSCVVEASYQTGRSLGGSQIR